MSPPIPQAQSVRSSRLALPGLVQLILCTTIVCTPLMGLAAAQAAYRPVSCSVGIVPPRLMPGDRIASLIIRSDHAALITFGNIPPGWRIIVDNNPSSDVGRPPNSLTIRGQAQIGVAYIDVAQLRAMTFRIARLGRLRLSGTATIANSSQRDRQIALVLSSGACRH